MGHEGMWYISVLNEGGWGIYYILNKSVRTALNRITIICFQYMVNKT